MLNTEQLIGRHFKLKHLIWSNIAKNNSINNMPGIDGSPSQTRIIENLRALMVNVVDKIVDIYPNLIINSGYRCIKLNSCKEIQGSKTSQHVYGQAVDLSLPGRTSAELYNQIYNKVGKWDQLIWEFPEKGGRSWVHVSYGGRNRRKTTLASNVKTYHDLYGGKRCGSTDQYQHDIKEAQIG